MSASSNSVKVLVIEDNRDFAYLLCLALRQLGHDVDSVNNGTDGIEKAREMKPDIIFCDIGLPGLTGFEVARMIKDDASVKDAYMIALTGYASLSDKSQTLQSGFNKHLSKPVSLADLVKVLNEVPALSQGF